MVRSFKNTLVWTVFICLGLIYLILIKNNDVIEQKKPFMPANQKLYEKLLKEPVYSLNLTSPRIGDNCSLICLVVIGPDDFNARNAIRTTWAHPNHSLSLQNDSVRVIFVVGLNNQSESAILKENELYNDILMVNVVDSYLNLVYKELAAFRWVNAEFSRAAIMKIDSDVVVKLDKMYETTLRAQNEIHCKVWRNVKPVRTETSPWYVPQSFYSDKYFPPYCNGPLYLVGAEALRRLLTAAKGNQVVEVEDVFFTGLLASQVGVHLVDNGGILSKKPSAQVCSNGKATVIGYPLHHAEYELTQSFKEMMEMPCMNWFQLIWFNICSFL